MYQFNGNDQLIFVYGDGGGGKGGCSVFWGVKNGLSFRFFFQLEPKHIFSSLYIQIIIFAQPKYPLQYQHVAA